MKYNKFFIAFAFCIAMQPAISFCAQGLQEPLENKSYWQRGKEYAASWVPQSVKDTINQWSTRKKIGVLSAIIGTLVAIYNKDQIIQWVDNIIKQHKLDGMAEEIVLLAIANKEAQHNLDWFGIRETKAKHDAINDEMIELVNSGAVSINDVVRAMLKATQKHVDEL